MKNLLWSLAALACVLLPTTHALAQGDDFDEVGDRVESLRIAFFTQRLNLSAQEATAFWPVYNEYTAAQKEHRKSMRAFKQASDNLATLGDAEVEKLVQQMLALRKDEYDVLVTYTERFKQVLPMRKVVALFRAEHEFRNHLLRELRERRDAGDAPPPGRPGGPGRRP